MATGFSFIRSQRSKNKLVLVVGDSQKNNFLEGWHNRFAGVVGAASGHPDYNYSAEVETKFLHYSVDCLSVNLKDRIYIRPR